MVNAVQGVSSPRQCRLTVEILGLHLSADGYRLAFNNIITAINKYFPDQVWKNPSKKESKKEEKKDDKKEEKKDNKKEDKKEEKKEEKKEDKEEEAVAIERTKSSLPTSKGDDYPFLSRIQFTAVNNSPEKEKARTEKAEKEKAVDEPKKNPFALPKKR